ncbi:MAG: hypothetical protein HC905_28875 [Bacteroidales bacterium]|nr:hypothetical protein [Bacteroidales bacterium]
MTTVRLTKEDIKKLKYNCRPGIIISSIIYLIGFFLIFGGFIESISENIFFSIMSLSILSITITFMLIRKSILDIRNGEKILELKTINQKEYKLDYEAGSGTLIGQEMKQIDIWYLIIDNHKYSVEKDLFDSAKNGDEIYFHIAPNSKELLKMELKK